MAKVCKNISVQGKNHYVEVDKAVMEMFQLNTEIRSVGFKSVMIDVLIENMPVSMELDSVTGVPILPEEFVKSRLAHLQIFPMLFKLKGVWWIWPVEEVIVKIQFKKKEENCILLVVQNGCRALLGRDLLSVLGLRNCGDKYNQIWSIVRWYYY